jgi:MFS family permease
MRWTPSWWRWLSPWGKFKLEDDPEVLEILPRCKSRKSSLDNSLSAEPKLSSDRFPDDVPAIQEIESASSVTEIGTSICSGQTMVAKDTRLTIEVLRGRVDAATISGNSKERKAAMINLAINDIGVGLYQYKLFLACAFGWLCDGIWILTIALIVPQLVPEFGITQGREGFALEALYAGLFLGAFCWGATSDITGRKTAFNLTLPITALAGLGLSLSTTWWSILVSLGCIGIGVGGNIPVDGNLFVEFLPEKDNDHMIFMSPFWASGSILTSGVARAVIPKKSCLALGLLASRSVMKGTAYCTRESNNGWRIHILAMFGVTAFMCVYRTLLFHLLESPRCLINYGRQRQAVTVVQTLAWYNSRSTWLSEELLDEIGGQDAIDEKLPIGKRIRRNVRHFHDDQLKPLFSDTRLGINTTLLWFCWLVYGIAMPLFGAFLPGLLSKVGDEEVAVPLETVFTTSLISSVAGLFGPPVAALAIKTPLGQEWSAAIGTLLTAVVMALFPLAKTSNEQLAVSCAVNFLLYGAWSILIMFTSQLFPAKCRGTGSGTASSLSRVGGITAPIIAVEVGLDHARVLVFTAGGLIGIAGLALIALAMVARRTASKEGRTDSMENTDS